MGQTRPSNKASQQQQQQQPSWHEKTLKLEDTLQQFMKVSISNHKSTKASVQNFETQLGQRAKNLEEKFEKNVTTNIEVNPIKHCNVIITRIGKVLEEKVEKSEVENNIGSEINESDDEKNE